MRKLITILTVLMLTNTTFAFRFKSGVTGQERTLQTATIQCENPLL